MSGISTVVMVAGAFAAVLFLTAAVILEPTLTIPAKLLDLSILAGLIVLFALPVWWK